MPNSEADLRAYASIELNMLHAAGAVGGQRHDERLSAFVERPAGQGLEGRELGQGTPIFDLNGTELFQRVQLLSDRGANSYVDVASNPAMGGVVLAVSYGLIWDEGRLRSEANGVVGSEIAESADLIRFVAYSYPKIGVQYLLHDREIALIELWTWVAVPPRPLSTDRDELPSNFERWSFLDDHPGVASLAPRRTRFNRRVRELESVATVGMSRGTIRLEHIEFAGAPVLGTGSSESPELRYSSRPSDHGPCFEVRGQETNVWCVGASTQMLLDFYRYEYSQVRIAGELGLGTLTSPNPLRSDRVSAVVSAIDALTSHGLSATLSISPTWALFTGEVRANRPMISFVPGHSRTVAGYTSTATLSGVAPFRGLLVYDPWPPNAGVVTRWENFDAHTYTHAFTARVALV